MEPTVDTFPVATVKFPTLRGQLDVELFDGDSVSFGRGGNCRIRFGHIPTLDRSVPRLAGTLAATAGRVVVNSPTHTGHRALEIHRGSTKTQIPIGQGVSLAGQFEVVVRGESKVWTLKVTVHQQPNSVVQTFEEDPSTAHVTLKLTTLQWKVLRAYYDPIRRGGNEPATHQEVANALGFHINTVRNKIYEIRDLMYINGLQMLDTSDARVAVVAAARIHGLIDE